MWLGVRPHVRVSAAQLGKPLPRDSAPNHHLLHKAVRVNTRRAVGMRSTKFVRQVLHQLEGATVARCVARCRPGEYRVWVKASADRYPVNSYLHQCQLVPSPHCPYCPGQPEDETLAHFTTICPRFREARTAGHNRVRAQPRLRDTIAEPPPPRPASAPGLPGRGAGRQPPGPHLRPTL